MDFSSHIPYLDQQNWHLQLQQSNNHHTTIGGGENPNIPPPPPSGGGGGIGGEGSIRAGSMVDRARIARQPIPEPGLNCPRCHSTNTKFCYYNNYSLTQPRYFCKTCRRYWTQNGALRNVPVGGGCRKNRKNNKNRSSKSPSQTARPKSVSESPSRCSTEKMSSIQIPHPPTLRVPYMNSISQYGSVGSNILSNLNGFPAHSEMGGFQLGSGSSNGNNFNHILSTGGVENWRSPFLAGFEVPSNTNLFHYQNEGVAEALSSSMVGGDMPIPNTRSDIITQVEPPVKMEGNSGLNLSREFPGGSLETDNQHSWVRNAWANYSSVNSTSSTTPTTCFL